MNTETMRLLISKGLNAEDLLEIAEAMDAGKARNTNAERQARFRARRKERKDHALDVISNVTSNGVTPPIEEIIPPVSSDEETKHPRKTKSEPAAKPEGVKDQTWADFLDLRKRKRAPLTQTAMDGITAEAAKAGWGMEAALAKCLARGWQSFEAGWVDAQKPPGAANTNDLLGSILGKQQATAP